MPEYLIESLDDPRLEPFHNLKFAGSGMRETLIAEGEKLVLRLLGSPCRTESILGTAAALDRLRDRIPANLPIYVASTPVISRLIGFKFHRGVLACGTRPTERSLDSLWRNAGTANRWESLIVVCPELRDPTNLGTIIRTAAAFGASGMIVGRAGVEPFSRRVLRTSMGSALQLPIVQTDNWDDVLERLHGAGYESIAAVLDPSVEPLVDVHCPARLALFLGNEDAGLPLDLVRRCRRPVTLPMAGGVNSLNVAVAAGIVLHHFARNAANS